MTKRRTILALALLAPVAALTIAAGRGDDTAAIKKNAEEFEAAWNKHDVKALAGFWAKDGDLIDPWGVVSNGQGEVEKFFGQQHTGTGPLAKSTYNMTKDTVRMISPDVALSDWEVTITGLAKPDGTLEGPMFHRVVIVSKKEGGAWKIAAARPSLPQPPAEKAAAPKAPEKPKATK
jgi:uncharacterized protein (TIGR02246 family)